MSPADRLDDAIHGEFIARKDAILCAVVATAAVGVFVSTGNPAVLACAVGWSAFCVFFVRRAQEHALISKGYCRLFRKAGQ